MKKIFVIVIMLILIFTGCSRKGSNIETSTDNNNENNNNKKEDILYQERPLAKFYGTWRLSEIFVDGERKSFEDLKTSGLGMEDGVYDVIIVISENGSFIDYSELNNLVTWVDWSAGPDNDSLVVDDPALTDSKIEVFIEDGKLYLVQDGKPTIYLEKASERQDVNSIDELVGEYKLYLPYAKA